MAPLRNPPLVANEANEMILGERAAIITKKKIQNMFRIALDNGNVDRIVCKKAVVRNEESGHAIRGFF